MDTIRKCLLISGMGAMWIVGILLMVRVTRSRHNAGMYEKARKEIDERLRESKAALDKATAYVQSVFKHINP